MNSIKSEHSKMADSNNPIEAMLQQTGWSLEEALLRISNYKSSTCASNGQNSEVKSDVKVEVKEEMSDYYRLFLSVNKHEEESDSDVEIIDEYVENCEKDDTKVQESVASVEVVDANKEDDIIVKSTVIDTNSVSDKSESSCKLFKDDTINIKRINTKVRNKSKSAYVKRKKQFILKKYRCFTKLRNKREIEKAEKKAAEVRKRLKLQLELLREKKKPNLKFLCSQPEIDAQSVSENPPVEHNQSLFDEKDLNEDYDVDVLETGDSDLMIVDVVGGYESPVREETKYDLENLSYDEGGGVTDMEVSLNSSENATVYNENQLPEYGESNSIQSKATSKLKICENIKQSLEYEERNNIGENFESMQCDTTRSTGNFLRNLSKNIFSKAATNAITPTKTKDITKIKGWKNKHFVKSGLGKPTISKDSSFNKTHNENLSINTSAFVSEQLDQLLSSAPKSDHIANSIQEHKSTIDSVIASTALTVSTTSRINDTSTKFINSLDRNIASSPAFNSAIISTTSVMTGSSSSIVSTISTFPPVLSISSTNSTTTLKTSNISSTSSMFNTIKPYKPKTLAEKRRLLEESRLPLTAGVLHSMNKKQRRENRGRILNFRNQLLYSKVPFDRESYTISSDITNIYSYITCNGKKLKVVSRKNDVVLANIKYRRKMSKAHIQARKKIFQLGNVKKPSLLESLKEPPKNVQYDSAEWETVEMKLPKVSLSVVPQYGQRLHPQFEHLIQNETWNLSENRVKFALSLLRTKNTKSKLHTFKFPLSYANKQETMKLKRKVSVPKEIDEIVIIESDDEIQQGVNSVMDKLLNYVDVLDETEKMNIKVEIIESSTEKPILAVPKVGRPAKRRSGPRSKINKTALEMKRLNCKIVSVANDEESTENENCTKEVCKLGCICNTLRCDSKNLVPVHCGSWQCIFKCSCKTNNNMNNTSLPSGNNLLNAGVINRLQDQAKKNLAKVEKEFTQTIIKTSNQLIMVGDSQERRRRVTKTPKKYNDYLNEDLTDSVDSDNHQWSTDDEVLSALPDNIKPCSVPLTKYNLEDIIPYCMIHSMYKCDCLSKSESENLLFIPTVEKRPQVPVLQKPESPKNNTVVKKRKKYKQRNTLGIDGFVKPVAPKYIRKRKDNKTFNKEEFCSRTRGIPTSYYVTRNTMESQLDKMLRSSKRYCRELSRYVRSLRVKLNELRRTSLFIDPVQAKKEELERELLYQTIDRLSGFLPAEGHLDNMIARLLQRMNGVVTPETMRRNRPSEIQSINTETSQVAPEETSSKNNLKAIVSCYKNNTSNGDEPTLPCPNDIQEKYMSSSKQKEFRLLPWASLQNNYNKRALEIWYLNTTKISPIIITQKNKRPSVNHCNIRVFEHLKEDTSIPLDFIRCIIRRKVPMNKNLDNISVILAFNETNCSEVYSICEKSSGNDNVNNNIRVSLLQQIKESPSSKDIDIESVATKEMNEPFVEEDEEEVFQGEFHHYDVKNESNLVNYFIRKFQSHTLYYDNVNPYFFDTKRDVRLPLPQEAIKCKWRLIYTDEDFAYLRLVLNDFTIKHKDIMKVVQLARNKRKTVILTSDCIQKHYSHKIFGIYCVPNYLDKIFIGPYLVDEDHNIDIIHNVPVHHGSANETIAINVTNGLWVNQVENFEKCDDLPKAPESCIDLTDEEDELKTILQNWNCKNVLKILGFSSNGVQNNDVEDATNYEEDTYWNELNLSMKGIDFEKLNDKVDNEVMEKFYYSIKNKSTIRYFITNIPGLGYIKGFLHEVTNVVDIMCPLTNKIRRFPKYNSAVNGITRILVQNIIIIPAKLGLKIRMLAKLNPTMKTTLSSTVLDGYHIAGSFGVKNIRDSSREDLKKIGLTDNEVELVVAQRRKRRIYDLTNQLAQNFSLKGTSAKRPHGDVLTEVIKKIISTIKLSTAGSSIKNIEKSLKLINLYPTTIQTQIYKQLEYVAFNLNKKELSTAELQKIRVSPQKRKSASPKSPITTVGKTTDNIVNKEMAECQKIRVFSQKENAINLETQASPPTNISIKELQKSQFQKVELTKKENVCYQKPENESKLITNENINYSDIRQSLPNEKFLISKFQEKSNIKANDVIITKLNRLHSFGTTIVNNTEKKKNKLIDDDVIIIEPEPTTVRRTKSTSLLRNQKQLELKRRNVQTEDNVIIQPESKRVKRIIQNDVIIQPELKNHIKQLRNGAIKPTAKNSVLQNNIVVAPTKSATHKRLQVLLANGNTTSLLKGKYINLLPLKTDGENKYVILPNKDNATTPLLQNIETQFKRSPPGIQNGKKVLVTPQNGKSLLVPQSTNVTTISTVTKSLAHRRTAKNEKSLVKVIPKTKNLLLPNMTSLNENIPANQKLTANFSELKKLVISDDKDSSSFITIQSGDTTQCFKVLNKNMDSVKSIITGQVVRPSHELPK